MDFRGKLKSVSSKPATQDEFDEASGEVKKEAKPALMTIQLMVENPPDELATLLNRLSNDGEDIQVELSSYQMALR